MGHLGQNITCQNGRLKLYYYIKIECNFCSHNIFRGRNYAKKQNIIANNHAN